MIALKYVAKIVAGQSPQSSEVSDYASGTPFLQGNAEFSMQFPDARYECDTAPKRANTGDILLSVRAPVGALNISDRPYGIGRGLCAVRATDCDPRFLWWWFHSQQSALEAVSMGSTYQAVTAEEVSMLEFPTLQTEEQRRIADFLDAETARIDQLGQMLRGALALLLERDSTNANTAFDGPGPKVQLRRLVSRWVDYRGATPAKTERGVPLITAKNISDGRVEHDRSPEFISTDDYDEWMRRGLPRPGDVLLTTEAPLGEVALLEDAAVALAQRVILMRTHKRLDSEWIYWYFRSPIGKSELSRRATGSTALGIKADRLRSVPIPTFPPDEQRRRVEGLKLAFQATDRLRVPIFRQLDLLAERRQALITAAVTGQFDVTTARGVDLS